jgi:hypothetical protein
MTDYVISSSNVDMTNYWQGCECITGLCIAKEPFTLDLCHLLLMNFGKLFRGVLFAVEKSKRGDSGRVITNIFDLKMCHKRFLNRVVIDARIAKWQTIRLSIGGQRAWKRKGWNKRSGPKSLFHVYLLTH